MKGEPTMTPEEEADWVKRAQSGRLHDEIWISARQAQNAKAGWRTRRRNGEVAQ